MNSGLSTVSILFDLLYQRADLPQAEAYVTSHSPEQMIAELQHGTYDPNDMLCAGDILRVQLEQTEHSIAMYQEGLKRLEEHPELKAHDIDLAEAYMCLCPMLVVRDKTGDLDQAIAAYLRAVELKSHESAITHDPLANMLLGSRLYLTRRFGEALPFLDRFLQVPVESLSARMQSRGADARNMRQAILNNLGARPATTAESLGNLEWYAAPGLRPLPNVVPALKLSALAQKLSNFGVSKSALHSVRSAVLYRASDDGKAWFVGLFEEEDPMPKIRNGGNGKFMVSVFVDPADQSLRGFDISLWGNREA
jgi:tetratricopeptide (TPR) repeat protein